MTKLKITYIVSSLCNEGPVNVMYNIIRFIDFNKFDVSIITLIPEKKHSQIQLFEKFPLKIICLSPDSSVGLIKLFWRLKKAVIDIKPDILHSHCSRSLYLMSFLPNKFKRIYTIHIYPGLQQEVLYGKFKGRIVSILNNFFTHYFVHLPIACAESVSEQFHINRGWNIKAIPNGSSLPIWDYNEDNKAAIREKLSLDQKMKYFIFIGRFSQEKNPDVLIEAFKQIKNGNVGLLMLGNGPMWSVLKKEETNLIKLIGFKENIYEYLIASDYYISASDVEGLANTLLESMTVGLPMVVSGIPSHWEVLNKTNRKIGCVFDPKDISSLINAIENILKEDRFEISRIIKNIYEQNYTAEKMSIEYQSTYITFANNGHTEDSILP